MSWLVGGHKKSARTHYYNEFIPETTFCGLSRAGRHYVLTQERKRVTCGNCIALLATVGEPKSEVRPGVRVLWVDSGVGEQQTVWEQVEPGWLVPLDRYAQPLRGAPMATVADVDRRYGPLVGVSEVTVLQAAQRELLAYVLNNI